MLQRYRVEISPTASRQLREIFDYIYRQSPQTAGETLDRIQEEIHGLEAMRSRFRIAGRSRRTGNDVHACVVHPFIIYFRVDEQALLVGVLEIRRGARRQPRRFD